jgi:hypothetical protein
MRGLRDAVDPGVECAFGAWHGDFGPWNAAWGTDALEVWDWERFDPDVPVGLDAAHWRTQLDVGTDPSAAWPAMCRDVEAVLDAVHEAGHRAGHEAGHRAGHGRARSSTGALVAGCYVLAIWARYRRDAAESATPALRARVTWLCSLAATAAPVLEGLGG